MNYVEEYHNNLSKDFCQHVIRKFDCSKDTTPGLSGRGLDINIKDSTDLYLTDNDDWKEEDETFFKALKEPMDSFQKKYIFKRLSQKYDTFDTGYQIQRTTPLQKGYTWHHDGYAQAGAMRLATYLWYLNTIDEGGTTEFDEGHIKPEEGKLIIFPPFWTHFHKGNPPRKMNKYIVTGWVYMEFT